MSHQQWDTSKTVKSKDMKLQWGERWRGPQVTARQECRWQGLRRGVCVISVRFLKYWTEYSECVLIGGKYPGDWANQKRRHRVRGMAQWVKHSLPSLNYLGPTRWKNAVNTSPVNHLNFTHSPCDTHRHPRLHTGTPTINKQTNKCNFLKKKEYTWSLCGN